MATTIRVRERGMRGPGLSGADETTLQGYVDAAAAEVVLAAAEKTAAQGHADAAQAWAEGTEPGGPGTKSAEEHAADSAASAADSLGYKNGAEAAAATALEAGEIGARAALGDVNRSALWQAKREAYLRRTAPANLVLSRNLLIIGDSVSAGVGSSVEFKNLLDARIAVNANFTATSSGTTLTVSAVANGTIARDQIVNGNGNYRIVQQLTGTTGGVGTYELAASYSQPTPIAMTSRYYAFRIGTAGTKTSDHLTALTNAAAWQKRADTIETSGSINDYDVNPRDRQWAWDENTKDNMDAMEALLTDGATFFIFHVWSNNIDQGNADAEYHIRLMRETYGARFVDVRAEMVADVMLSGRTGPDDFFRRRLAMPAATFAGYGSARPRNFAPLVSHNSNPGDPTLYTDGQLINNQFSNILQVKNGALGAGSLATCDVKHPGNWGHRLMDQLAADLINALRDRAAPFIPSGLKALIPVDAAANSSAIILPCVGDMSRIARADIIAGDDDGYFAIDRETLAIRRTNLAGLTEGFRILVVELEDSAGNTRQTDVHLYVGMASTDTVPRTFAWTRQPHASGMTGNDIPSGDTFSAVVRGKINGPLASQCYLINGDVVSNQSRAYVRIETDGRLSLLFYNNSAQIIVNTATQQQSFATAQGKTFVNVPRDGSEFTLFLNIDWDAGVIVAVLNTAAHGDQQFYWTTAGTTTGVTALTGVQLDGGAVNWKYGYLTEPSMLKASVGGFVGGYGFVGIRVASDGGIDWTDADNRRLFANIDGSPAYAAGDRPEVEDRPWDLVPFNGLGKYDVLYGPQAGAELTRIGFEPWLQYDGVS